MNFITLKKQKKPRFEFYDVITCKTINKAGATYYEHFCFDNETEAKAKAKKLKVKCRKVKNKI